MLTQEEAAVLEPFDSQGARVLGDVAAPKWPPTIS
jgi:hypothetical protein